jgi:hypothetical protein
VNGFVSDPLDVNRSVRQGGVLSTFLYLVYVNSLLLELERSNYGSTVHSLKAGNPSFADDIALIAVTPLYLQRLIDIVYSYCKKWKIEINTTKSNTIVFTKRREAPPIGILYGDKFIAQSDHVIHLGISHDFNVKLKKRIEDRLQKARNSFFAMSAKGVNSEGVNPMVSVSLYCKITKPIALYGSELWCNLSESCIDTINRFQHFTVKQIQGFRRSTRSDMCESMVGLHKLHCDVIIRKLMFLHKLLSLDSNCISKKYL